MKKIDDYTVETVSKKGGKPLTTTKNVVSKDGKTRTTTQKGTNAKDEKVDNTLVYDKQQKPIPTQRVSDKSFGGKDHGKDCSMQGSRRGLRL